MEAKLKKTRATAKGKFTRKTRYLEEKLDENEPYEVTHVLYEEVKAAYEEVERKNDRLTEYYETLEAEGVEQLVKETENYIDAVDKKRVDLFTQVIKTKIDYSAVKVKSLPAPNFSGNLRKFGIFMKDYERLMVPKFGKDPYAFYSCLLDEAKRCVSGVEDSYEEMVERLQQVYGDPCRITDSVVKELRSLQPVPEGDSKLFIGAVDIIEKAWLDMAKLGLQSEMDNISIVTLVERILPRKLQHDWVLRAAEQEDNQDQSLFEKLLDFLLKEKRIYEYLDRDIRSSSSTKVNVCSVKSDYADPVDIKMALNELKVSQDNNNIVVSECLTNVAKLLSGMSKSNPERDKEKNNKYCWFHDLQGHDIMSCYNFKNLNQYEKMSVLRNYNVCFRCLIPGHISKFCKTVELKCEVLVNGSKCGLDHHYILHDVLCRKINNHLLSLEGYLLEISTVKSTFANLSVLWDSGSTTSLITHDKARELNLKGTNVTVSITKVGNTVEIVDSREYIVPVIDVNGEIYNIKCCGMDEISAPVRYVDVRVASQIFPCIKDVELTRPFGVIHMLVGIDNTILLPQVVDTKNNLQLLKNRFGYVLRGSHPAIMAKDTTQRNAHVQIYHAKLHTVEEIQVSPRYSIKDDLEKYFDVENLGIACVPKCGSCRCGKCAPGNKDYPLKEERELNLITEGLSYDHNKLRWFCKYPWIRDPFQLPNNFPLGKACLKSTEKRLKKLGPTYCEAYQNEMQSMIDRGAARKLSMDELQNYKGPVFYIPHTEVLNPKSLSTPLRIVFNSSARFCGFALNDMWAKGPDVLNSLYGILLRFREPEIAFTCDLTKMFNQVELSVFDQHCHRVLWRNLDESREPDHYCLTCASFGDKCAGIIAMLALKFTAEMYMEQFPVAASLIVNNSYVDDIVGGAQDMDSACRLMEEINYIVSRGGFKIKHFVMSKDYPESSSINLVKMDDDTVLGVKWAPHADFIYFTVKINFSTKYRKVNKGPDLTASNFLENVPEVLTKRIVFSITASQYDPLGLINPVMVGGKLLMRKSVQSNTNTKYDWDDPLSPEIRWEWIEYFIRLFEIENIKFSRCIKNKDYVGDPMLILFSDASTSAYGACAYLRYELSDGSFESRLLTAKGKLAPIKSLTIPRLELLGALISARLRASIIKEMTYTFCRIIHIVDSAIVRSQIQKESYGFGTFTATKIAEIQDKSSPEEWWWISGTRNPADMVSRSALPKDLAENSEWQLGPSFLSLPFELWPIKKDPVKDLPDKLKVYSVQMVSVGLPTIGKCMDLNRFSCYFKLIRVTCRVLNVFSEKSLKGIRTNPITKLISKAELVWIKEAQSSIKSNWQARFCRLGPMINEDGVIMVGQRMSKWLKFHYDKEGFILLPISHEFTQLLVSSFHNDNHAGVETVLAQVQSKYWIPKVRNFIRFITNKCVMCRKLRKQVSGQIMGPLPDERLKPSPAFAYTALDLFGPFAIRDAVKRRTKGKGYGVIFNCLTTRAVSLDLIEGYSTKDFIDGFRRFISIRGCPIIIYSDCGSQLSSFNKELQDMSCKWDRAEIQDCTTKSGGKIEWKFTASNAQFQNGVSEALIKSVKKCLVVAIGDSILTFSKLQSTLFEIANILNRRPIGIKPVSNIELGRYLCPNDLLLGRSTGGVPSGIIDQDPSFQDIMDFNDNIVNAFWKKWTRDFWPSLLVRQKWHFERRNLCVGDVVILQDSNAIKNYWKLGEIVVAGKSKDGKVRNVSIRYKPRKEGVNYKGLKDIIVTRSAHKVVVILPVEEK